MPNLITFTFVSYTPIDGVHNIVRVFADGTFQELPLGGGAVNTVDWYYSAADGSPEGFFVVHNPETQELHYLDVTGDNVTLRASVTLRWAPELGLGDFHVAMDDFVFDVSGDGTIYTYQRNYDKDPDELVEIRGTLLKIDGDLNSPDVGTVSIVGPVDPAVAVHVGAMFFTSGGELYGYSSLTPPDPGLRHNRLVAIDKFSGAIELVGEGPEARSNDGCSCPFTVGLTLQTDPAPGACQSTINYDVVIENSSVEEIRGVVFTDTLPAGMTVAQVMFPDGESLVSEEETGVGYGVLTIPDLTLPAGEELSFTIRADVRGLSGQFSHQAHLTGLPASLGNVVVSDDTTTAQAYDPTQVMIQEIPLLRLSSDTLLCAGDLFTLAAQVDPNWSIHWTGPDSYYSEDASPTVALPQEEDRVYYYLHQQRDACTLLDSMLIRTLPAPTADIIADTTVTRGASLLLGRGPTGATENTYAWTPAVGLSCTDCANPQATPSETTEYTLVVSNALGCTKSAAVTVEVVEDKQPEPEPPLAPAVHVPNAFTPNNDGLNDIFLPVAGDQVEVQRFEVYNRWGELLYQALSFQSNDSGQGWDGTYRGKVVATGTYTYRLIALVKKKGRREYQGQVQLLR